VAGRAARDRDERNSANNDKGKIPFHRKKPEWGREVSVEGFIRQIFAMWLCPAIVCPWNETKSGHAGKRDGWLWNTSLR